MMNTETAPAIPLVLVPEPPSAAEAPAVPPLGGYAAKRCPTRTFHDLVTDPELAVEASPGVVARMADGVLFEADVFDRLAGLVDFTEPAVADEATVADVAARLAGAAAVKVPDCDRTPVSKRRRETITIAALTVGVPLVWNARLPVVDGRTGEPDLLVRDTDGGYVPVDVKHHRSLEGAAKARTWRVSPLAAPFVAAAAATVLGDGVPRSDDNSQLAHYQRMLESLGFASASNVGGIIGKELVVVWRHLDVAYGRSPAPLDGYDTAFGVVADVARAAVERPDDGPLVAAVWRGECAECPWRMVCHDDLVERDHVSLLAGVTPARVALHAARGVTTRRQLARVGVDDVRYTGTPVEVLRREVDQARVAVVGRPHLARETGFVSVPRAAFELDVDIEDADGRCYLIGVADTWRRTRNGSVKSRTDVHAFVDWTGTDEGEARIFAEFWAYLCAQQAKAAEHRWGFRVYHYSEHETRYFRHLARKHAGVAGVPTVEDLDAFLTGPAWVDLYPIVRTEVVWPAENHGLKTIAGLCGFSWRDDEPGGGNSTAWYAEAVADPDRKVRDASRARLLAYNEDDVLATLAIRDWLTRKGESRQPGKALPSVTQLERRFTSRRP